MQSPCFLLGFPAPPPPPYMLEDRDTPPPTQCQAQSDPTAAAPGTEQCGLCDMLKQSAWTSDKTVLSLEKPRL